MNIHPTDVPPEGIEENSPSYYAAVDLGSNSFHMILARQLNGQLQIVDRLRDMVRLRSGLMKDGSINEETQARALAALTRFGDRLSNVPAEHIRVVGTYTLRRARNSNELLRNAAKALGHPVEIISGQEEARLIYRGVAFTQGVAKEKRLVFDIGGGSTELILGEGPTPILMESLFMGCVSYSTAFFKEGRISLKQWQRAEIAARLELQPVESQFRLTGWSEAIGTSGSIRSISNVLLESGISDGTITPAGLALLKEKLLVFDHINDINLPGLSSDRKSVFAGGLVILTAIFDSLGIDRLSPCDAALREGLLDEMAGPGGLKNVREQTVKSLLRLYHADENQAAQVADTAVYLFDQVAKDWELKDPELRELLAYSAQLHEVGLAVSHSGYHKHGHYLLSHGDLAGFSKENQHLVATLVRLHRRKILPAEIDKVASEYVLSIQPLILLLRLAVLIHRNRMYEPHPEMTLSAHKNKLHLQCPRDWFQAHPLMDADLSQETRYLKSIGFKLTYSECSD
ncbi:MAG TPA: exopolyphosphatase [Gammaproteobacteria bacterium]|nr:exopolyphosphatase [Gammaproteobacteria bacterium]